MFVSTREATSVYVLARPAAIIGLCCGCSLLVQSRVSLPLPLRSLIKQCQSFFDRQFLPRPASRYWDDTDCFSGGNPVHFVSGPNSILIRNRFRYRQLQFARDL